MGSQPPYGYDPQNPGTPPPGYGQPPTYPQQYGQPPMQPGYPPPGYAAMPGQMPAYPGYGGPIAQPDQNGGLAIAALVFGILSLLASILTFCDLPFIILGIIFGILGRRSIQRGRLATIGLVLSVVGFVIAAILLIAAANSGMLTVTTTP